MFVCCGMYVIIPFRNGVCCEQGNEQLHAIKGGKYLDWYSNYQLPKNTIAL
jgi:hypothetical protein